MRKSNNAYMEAALLADYIKTDNMAKEAVKAVLGILVSALPEEDAHRLTDLLPDDLTYKKLRGHQDKITGTSPEDCIAILSDKLQISEGQARKLMLKIISVVKIEAKNREEQIIGKLSTKWRNAFQKV